MKYRWGIWISLVLGLLLLVSFVASAQLPAGITREETLVVDQLTGRVGMPNNFNLWAGWRNQDRGIQQLLLDPLWTVDYATGEIISGMAAGLPVYNDDFTQMTINLREGCTWSDGVPVTADDVIFTIDIHINTQGLLYHGPMVQYVEKVCKIDDLTVVVGKDSRFADFVHKLVTRALIDSFGERSQVWKS